MPKTQALPFGTRPSLTTQIRAECSGRPLRVLVPPRLKPYLAHLLGDAGGTFRGRADFHVGWEGAGGA